VFGLSTVYEVFLLSRIREKWLESGDARRSIAEGLAVSARTITGAAAIIVCVFAVFVGTGIPIIKEIGLGSAFAIGIDATLIRLVLVPAVMTLLGDWSWWMPRWLRQRQASGNHVVSREPCASEDMTESRTAGAGR
jgi:RND superfamily putative drug exporter